MLISSPPPQISILIGHNDLCSKSCLTAFQSLGLSRRVRVEPRDYERNIRKSRNRQQIMLTDGAKIC